MLRLALAAVAALSLLSAGPRAQIVQRTTGPTMLATDQYLFVLRGDQIFQFEIHTLKLLHKAELPADPNATRELEALLEMLRDAKSAPQLHVEVSEEPIEEVVEEPILQDTEVTETEEVEEGPEAEGWVNEVEEPGVGGKYGDRRRGPRALAARGSKETAEAISTALRWLAQHQDPDGRWNADEFMKQDSTRQPTDGPGNPVHDVGLTGLALLAFLADGNTLRSGPYRENVKKGITWLRDQQDPETGLIGSNSSNEFIYDHAIATLALVESYGLSDYKLLKRTAQSAIDYLERHRNPYAVWRYQPRDGDNDTSVTAWCVMAYRSAKDFELDVNEQALKLALVWIDQMTDPVSGRTGYTERGGFSSRRAGDHSQRFPRENNEAMTAAALFCRFLLGQDPKDERIMLKQADLVASKPPRWEEGFVDEYAWLFGSHALYQAGGRYWRTWSDALVDAIVPNQRHDDNFAGSWDPVGVWAEDGGRIYTTALLCLSLQTYYRYTRLIR